LIELQTIIEGDDTHTCARIGRNGIEAVANRLRGNVKQTGDGRGVRDVDEKEMARVLCVEVMNKIEKEKQ
jgi:hypothetical protein